jgi:hypothetical protein
MFHSNVDTHPGFTWTPLPSHVRTVGDTNDRIDYIYCNDKWRVLDASVVDNRNHDNNNNNNNNTPSPSWASDHRYVKGVLEYVGDDSVVVEDGVWDVVGQEVPLQYTHKI